ncbi:polysaccharide biosynthesis tyrosine autokinase [Rhodococcus sp. BP-332]|uniref:polysaccharide biosynthesis tyrosine autokinase n=1 Tax=Rhodococcus sp. BP-332 TaxID=2739447 RepID=UPI001C9B589E|nr:polysaccharide biosynthesis tyrosine autokinase [Rhodococcus sp. BP-332]MBY6678737.1 polysaccharide biosynthesis tyrosine autokinase [Rhodococcus sp. BP-332]
MDIREYFSAWRRHWVTIVLCTVLAVGAAGAVSALSQPTYVATARLFISTTGAGSISDAYQGSLFSTGRVASYAGLAVGKQVAERAIDELGLNVPPESVMSRVTAAAVTGSVLLDVTASDSDAAAARDLANAVASQTSQLVQELETAQAGQLPAATATVADFADLPVAPSSPRWGRNLVFGLFGGLILGLATAVGRSALDSTVHTDDDIAAGAAGPVLGVVPRQEDANADSLLLGSSFPTAEEAFREIRTAILALRTGTPPRTIVVAAPTVGTGSTTVAAGLAAALADTGRSVALIDADFRGGRLPTLFGIGGVPGLSELLRGKATLDDAVVPTDRDNLSIIGTGVATESSSALFGRVTMNEMVKQLHEYFEFVIIDAPPVLCSADAAVLAGVADGVLLVALLGSTTSADLTHSVGKLGLSGASVLGCVATSHRRRRLHDAPQVRRGLPTG